MWYRVNNELVEARGKLCPCVSQAFAMLGVWDIDPSGAYGPITEINSC